MKPLWRSIGYKKQAPRAAIPGLAVLTVCLAGFILLRFFPGVLRAMPPCLFRQQFGIPCPSCGATHAATHLSRFALKPAFLANPFFAILFVVLGLWGVASLTTLISGRTLVLNISPKRSAQWYWLLLLLFLLNWLFLIYTNLSAV
ncbi:MAG TPA: DUF2752 domain-containing protein [bacterium]|nr:DUF2752 domain-containing protein [bacterium]HPG45594.1 DUF2752 domain-containing protein [bacterium]HPM97627.1 DUF2752 domain-containing protein [bacterium]